MFWRLQCAAGVHDAYISPIGITFDEYLAKDTWSGEQNLIIAQDCEKVQHAAYTGEDFGGGRALLLSFKGVGTTESSTQAKRCHVMLIHETAVSCTESGCIVTM